MSESNSPQPSSSTSAPKPKAIKPRANIARKTKAEREAYAKQEAEKAAARAAAAAQTTEKSQSTKAGTVKKREQTRDNRDNSQGVIRGVFGAGTGSKPTWNKKVTDEGRSEILEGQEAAKPGDGPTLLAGNAGDSTQRGKGSGGGGGGGSGRNARKIGDGADIESDNEPDDPRRRDIEDIEISSDEDEQDGPHPIGHGKGKARAVSEGRKAKQSSGLRPVRAPRAVAEDQEATADKRGDRKVVKSSRTVTDDVDDAENDEDIDIGDPSAANQSQAKRDAPSSPELSKRTKPDKRSGSRAKESRLATETLEERAERIRLIEDVEQLKHEFVFSSKSKKDEDSEIEEGETRRDGKLFLFQFPPLVPYLVDQASLLQNARERQDAATSGTAIKSDPDGPAEPQVTETANSAGSQSALPKTSMEGMLTATEPLRLPSGHVGKLRIHKSGRLSLDWGGTDMEVRYGTEVDFLQDVALVESPAVPPAPAPAPSEDDGENKDKVASSQTGMAYALGRVQKKMIVIPDWQKLYD